MGGLLHTLWQRFVHSFSPADHPPEALAAARESLRIRAEQSTHSAWPVTVVGVLATAAFSVAVPLERVLAWVLPVIAMAHLNARVSRRALHGLDDADARAVAQRQARLWCMTIINQTLMGLTVWWIGPDRSTPAPRPRPPPRCS